MDINTYKLYKYFYFKNKNLLLGGGKKQWETLEHNGPMFPPEYKPHKIPVIINSKKYILPSLSEEYATLYSKYIGTAYVENKTFNKNFWNDFKKTLPKEILNSVKFITDIDFSLISNYLIEENIKKKNMSKEEKLELKKIKDKEEEKYKYCKIDGIIQPVGNYKIEPPAIFLGRGTHPKLGCIKKRIYPEDITINISKNVPIPQVKNHKWKKVIHDKTVVWLASWKDVINKKNKYVFTSFEGIFKSKSDEKKFDLARKLGNIIDKIRNKYTSQLNDKDNKIKQLATALYLIDKLALRIGNSKDTKKTADTVGVTSLRIEHIKLHDNNIIELDFLGKDSIRYCNKIKIDELPYNNIKKFIKDKTKNTDLFDLINPVMMNEYLNNFMKGLTSKVWRTYNASINFQNELNNINNSIINKMDKNEKINYLISVFNKANASVATLCNHQKNTQSKSNIDKINEQIKKLTDKKKKETDKNKINTINNKIIVLKLKKEVKNKTSNISLGTSKNNYIDPRIFFAFAKKHDIPILKIINESLLKRFIWASDVDKSFLF